MPTEATPPHADGSVASLCTSKFLTLGYKQRHALSCDYYHQGPIVAVELFSALEDSFLGICEVAVYGTIAFCKQALIIAFHL